MVAMSQGQPTSDAGGICTGRSARCEKKKSTTHSQNHFAEDDVLRYVSQHAGKLMAAGAKRCFFELTMTFYAGLRCCVAP